MGLNYRDKKPLVSMFSTHTHPSSVTDKRASYYARKAEQARMAYPYVDRFAADLCKSLGIDLDTSSPPAGRFKALDRVLEKFGGVSCRLPKDIYATRIVTDDIDALKRSQGLSSEIRAAEFRDAHTSIHECKDYFLAPRSHGYAGSIQLVVEVTLNKGRRVLSEIQITHPAMLEIEERSHMLYERLRRIQDEAEQAYDSFPPSERARLRTDVEHRIDCLKRQMRQHKGQASFDQHDEFTRLTFTKKGRPLSEDEWLEVKSVVLANRAMYNAVAWKHDLMQLRRMPPPISLRSLQETSSGLGFAEDASYLLYGQLQCLEHDVLQDGRTTFTDAENAHAQSLIDAIAHIDEEDSLKLTRLLKIRAQSNLEQGAHSPPPLQLLEHYGVA